MSSIVITGNDLTLEQLALICRENAKIELAEEAKQNIIDSRKVVDDLVAEEKVVYGITTGFGKFSDVVISQEQCKELQRNLIITHAVGAGDPFPIDVARGVMLLRINNLVKGFSGIRCYRIYSTEGFSWSIWRLGTIITYGSSYDWSWYGLL